MRNKILCAVLGFFLIVAFSGNVWSGDEGRKDAIPMEDMYRHPIMKPDKATRLAWIEAYENAPEAFMDEKLMEKGMGASVDLLSHVDYVPTDRNQGSCGNCWLWAGTGVMEIAHSVQNAIKDRLSIQYGNSCYTSSFACCGGWLQDVATFYSGTGMAIPWSNTNAHFQDGGTSCPAGSSSVSCGSVSTSPSYVVPTISYTAITTHGVSQATAIANIKNVLNQNKGVWFGFFLPDDPDWNVFFDFWNNDSESDVLDYDYTCGHTWDSVDGGGHAVLIVGYNDDANPPYWIVLNSWGTEAGRPNGLFRFDMDMDYSCTHYDPSDGKNYNAFYFQTLNVEFSGGTVTSTTTTGPITSTTTTISTTTTTAASNVNLKPYTPSGWSGPIVPSSVMGTNVVDTLCGGQTTYIDLALANEFNTDITETFYIDLYVDGVLESYWYSNGLQAGYYTGVEDYQTTLQTGTHILQLVVDSEDDVAETNESDNIYTQTFTWEQCGWSGPLYESILGEDSQERLLDLRRYRDEKLLLEDIGKEYVGLLYNHSEEIASLLLENPALSSHTAEVIENLVPGVKDLLDDEETTIPQELREEMGALLGEFEAKASPNLKNTIRKVKREIKRGTILRKLGVTVK